MNIIINKNERHPVIQVDVAGAVDLTDKKILFVYGRSRNHGIGIIVSSVVTDRLMSLANSKNYQVEAVETPTDLEDRVRAYWEGQGFNVVCVGIARDIRDNVNTADYKAFLTEIHRAVFPA